MDSHIRICISVDTATLLTINENHHQYINIMDKSRVFDPAFMLTKVTEQRASCCWVEVSLFTFGSLLFNRHGTYSVTWKFEMSSIITTMVLQKFIIVSKFYPNYCTRKATTIWNSCIFKSRHVSHGWLYKGMYQSQYRLHGENLLILHYERSSRRSHAPC